MASPSPARPPIPPIPPAPKNYDRSAVQAALSAIEVRLKALERALVEKEGR